MSKETKQDCRDIKIEDICTLPECGYESIEEMIEQNGINELCEYCGGEMVIEKAVTSFNSDGELIVIETHSCIECGSWYDEKYI